MQNIEEYSNSNFYLVINDFIKVYLNIFESFIFT